nr:hypothetical protein [Wolbachia endosymbiont of Brugia pahangi]
MHITGFVWLGGYGALRKSVDLSNILLKLAYTCSVVGRAISVVGKMLFIITVLSSLLKKAKRVT